ncbi:MAG: tetratricopeptide repeat protein, partial [Chloroflexaceae bacterium]|nr:tetratricopeptide repeat protein [Chloroflexaceae bacterium]
MRRLDLAVLLPEAAFELLKSLAGKQVEADEQGTKDLAEWLGRLPLALELVGRYVDIKAISIAEVQKRLERKRLAAPALKRDEDAGDMTTQHEGVAAAIELSWEDLSAEVQRLGCQLSLLAGAEFGWDLVEAWLLGETADDDEQEALEARRQALVNWSLLQITKTKNYLLHPLIREFLQAKRQEQDEADTHEYVQALCRTLAKVARQIPQSPTPEQIGQVSEAIPHLQEIANGLTDAIADEDLIQVFTWISWFIKV